MLRNLPVLILSLLFFAPFSVTAGEAADWFERGEKAYNKAINEETDFLDAAGLFGKAVSVQHAPSYALVSNLGNSFYNEGLYTEAYIAYSRALKIKPGDDKVEELRKIAADKLDIEIPDKRVMDYILWSVPLVLGNYTAWFILFLISICILFLILTKPLMKWKISPISFYVVAGFSLLLFAVNITWEHHDNAIAYIFNENSDIRKGPSMMFDSIGDFPPGTEVQILKTNQLWSEIRISGSPQNGWIRREKLMTFDDLVDKFSID